MRIELKIKIISTYGDQASFARACEKSDNWISRIVTGRSNPSERERELIMSKLKLAHDDDNNIFKNTQSF